MIEEFFGESKDDKEIEKKLSSLSFEEVKKIFGIDTKINLDNHVKEIGSKAIEYYFSLTPEEKEAWENEISIKASKEKNKNFNKKLAKLKYPLISDMDTKSFKTYFEAGKVLGLTEKEANFFAATAADYNAQKRMEITGINHNGVGSIKRVIGKKIGLLKFPPEERDGLLKEIANKLVDTDNLEIARIAYSDDAREKSKLLDEIVENKRIADMVRANPELLKMYEQMNQPQND